MIRIRLIARTYIDGFPSNFIPGREVCSVVSDEGVFRVFKKVLYKAVLFVGDIGAEIVERFWRNRENKQSVV
jgi:hypothetical protein